MTHSASVRTRMNGVATATEEQGLGSHRARHQQEPDEADPRGEQRLAVEIDLRVVDEGERQEAQRGGHEGEEADEASLVRVDENSKIANSP